VRFLSSRPVTVLFYTNLLNAVILGPPEMPWLFTYIREASLRATTDFLFSKHNPWRPYAVLWLVFTVEVWWHLMIPSLFSDQSRFCDLGYSSDPAHFSGLGHTVFLEYASRKKIVSDQFLNAYLHCRKGKTKHSPLQAH
jgi:hypothetical protein